MNGGLARSEAALIRSNQCLGVGLHSFTQYARKDLICDREKAFTPIIAYDRNDFLCDREMAYSLIVHSAYRGISLFQDRTQSTKVPIAGHAFFQPYSVD